MRKQLSNWKQIGVLCLALASAGAAWAAAPQPVPAPQAATEPQCPAPQAMPDRAALQQLAHQARDRGLLWKVEFQGRTSWLYGTIHVNKPEWMMPSPRIVQALQGVDRLALEINLLDPAVMQALVVGLRAAPGAAPLPAALQQRLDQQLRAVCAPEAVSALRPEAQMMTLATLVGRSLGLDPQFGVDMVLAGTAQALGKPVVGLETVQAQLSVLVSDDPEQVEDSVRTGLQQLEKGDAPQQLLQLAQVWADGDLRKLESYPQWCDCLNTAAERAEYARVVDARNLGMAATIAAQLRAGQSLFVAVGALHLIGPQGLPALLAAQGFAVQPVSWGAATRKTTAAQ